MAFRVDAAVGGRGLDLSRRAAMGLSARPDAAGDLDAEGHTVDVGRKAHAWPDRLTQVELDGIFSVDASNTHARHPIQFPKALGSRFLRRPRPLERYLRHDFTHDGALRSLRQERDFEERDHLIDRIGISQPRTVP